MVRRTKRGRKMDAKIRAKNRPRKRFKKGLGGQGDWARPYKKSRKPKRRRVYARNVAYHGFGMFRPRGLGTQFKL